MNIVYLIGNGFDLSLGLPTAWSHFYDYYFEQPNPSPTIKSFKEAIGENLKNWSDLEKELGKYTLHLHTREELITLHKDLSENLITYLNEVEANYYYDNSQSNKIINQLVFPEVYFCPAEKERIQQHKSHWQSTRVMLDVVSFNYTTVFEKLAGFTDRGAEPYTWLGEMRENDYQTQSVYLHQLEHIHGTTKQNMALGLNDASQFLNETFRGDRLLMNTYVKPQLNAIRQTEHDEKCQMMIRMAGLICVYGLSFGITDKRWWQYIGERLKRSLPQTRNPFLSNSTLTNIAMPNRSLSDTDFRDSTLLLIFFYNPHLVEASLPEIFEEKERIKSLFLSRTSLSEEEKGQVREKIFVSINSKMFAIDNKKFK